LTITSTEALMDPLSITASIIAVIQLTGSVISAAYNYRTGVNNAAEDAVRIIEDLTGLSQILEKLLKLLEKDRSTGSAQLASVNTLTRSDGPLEICQRRLAELKTKLQPQNGWRAVRKALTWPLKQDYVR
jgi:ankyrin repeat domain-containing protein 50